MLIRTCARAIDRCAQQEELAMLDREEYLDGFRLVCVGLAAGILTLVARADTLHVPSEYPTIQAAIDAAVDGDEIIVAPGTYHEAINFNGKALHLHSSDGPETTIID